MYVDKCATVQYQDVQSVQVRLVYRNSAIPEISKSVNYSPMGWVSNSKVWWVGDKAAPEPGGPAPDAAEPLPRGEISPWWGCEGSPRIFPGDKQRVCAGGEGPGHIEASTFTFGFSVYFCQNRLVHMRNPRHLPVKSFTWDSSEKAMAGKCFPSVSLKKKKVSVLIYWIPKSCQLKSGSVYLNFLVGFIV